MRDNQMKTALERGDIVCGATLAIMAPPLVELMGPAGFDFVIVDEQHGWASPETIADLIRTADSVGLTPMVRVPEIHSTTVGRYLDLGAQGIVFPNVNSADDARRAVASMRYEPSGSRSSCPTVRAAGYSFDDWVQHYERSNRDLFGLFLIETREAFDNLEEILNVEGIDGVVLGPIDLSSSLGLPGQVEHPEVVRRVKRASQLVLERGITLCGFGMGAESSGHSTREGARMFWMSGTTILANAMRESVAAVRQAARRGVASAG